MIARLESCLYSGVLQRTLSGETTVCLLCGVGPQGLGDAARWRSFVMRCAVRVIYGWVLGVFITAS